MKQVLSENTVPIDLKEPMTPVLWIKEFSDVDAEEFFALFNSLQSDDYVKNIVIYIDSYGGAVDSLCTMTELIEASTKPVITVVVGKAMSAGGILGALGTPSNRWIGPNSRVMLHRIQGGDICGDAETISTATKELLRINEMWLKKVINRSNLTWKEFNTKLKDEGGEWYITPSEAVKYGFADKIGIPIIKEVRQIIAEVTNEQTAKKRKPKKSIARKK